ncbi:hypothetical protein FB451DRAFT_1167928 [Mycena latifolia]|nr:hypothetical protein FB451DRAFT_1167928 [Mycena latifolia]
MPSCSKLIGFITIALVMGGAVHAQVVYDLLASFSQHDPSFDDDDGGGAQTQYNNAITGVCYKTSATARSIDPVPALLNAYFYRSGDCSRIAIDPELPTDIRYGTVTNTNLDVNSIMFEKIVPINDGLLASFSHDPSFEWLTIFIAYTDNDGGGAQTTYNEVVTGVRYKISATARSIKTVPVPLSYDCTHVVGDLDGGFSDVTYDQATNTRRDARSVFFVKRAPDSGGDPGDL